MCLVPPAFTRIFKHNLEIVEELLSYSYSRAYCSRALDIQTAGQEQHVCGRFLKKIPEGTLQRCIFIEGETTHS